MEKFPFFSDPIVSRGIYLHNIMHIARPPPVLTLATARPSENRRKTV